MFQIFDYKLTLNPTVNTLAYDVRVTGENTGSVYTVEWSAWTNNSN